MNVNHLKSSLLRNLSNVPGWRSNRKMVVIESDDWGSIRMPSLEAMNKLQAQGLDLAGGSNRYNSNDTLATETDLEDLFKVLLQHKDKNGTPAVFTAVSVVANPDFDKIKEHNFKEYFYEPFTKTLERYYGNDASYQLWLKGIKQKIFIPQFHGREHLNVAEWMRALQMGDREALLAFDERLWGFNNRQISKSPISFQAAFDLYEPSDLAVQSASITEGLELFNKLFGYRATFFVPPNGPFNNTLEKVAAEAGITYMSASKIQAEPLGYGKSKKVFHWLGQKNENNQYYITRNCFFEPGDKGKDWVDTCLDEISTAFRWNKPAIISSHRVNYIGALNPANKAHSLQQLNKLLHTIVAKWPDVQFCTSPELGDLMAGDRK